MTTAIENGVTTQVYTVYVKATPQAVWDAITRSEWTRRYGYANAVDYDLRPGGAYRGYATEDMLAHGASEVVVEGEVVEADEPHRLVQTWRALFGAEISAEPATRLTFAIESAEGRVTKLTVTHELDGAPITAGMVGGTIPGTGGGWSYILSDLKSLLETGTALAG